MAESKVSVLPFTESNQWEDQQMADADIAHVVRSLTATIRADCTDARTAVQHVVLQQNNYEHAGRLILGIDEPPRVWMMDYRGEKDDDWTGRRR
jgi:hypothetical protein